MIINVTKKYINNQPVLAPAYDSDKEKIVKLPTGQIWEFKPKRDRDIRHHNKFRAMLRIVFKNSDTWNSMDQLEMTMKFELGIGSIYKIGEKEVFVPESTDFSSMDEDTFNEKVYEPGKAWLAKVSGISVFDLESNFGEYL